MHERNIYYLFTGVFIVGAKRTPFGTYGGKFTKTSATDLQTFAAKAALKAASVNPEQVDSVVIGNVLSVTIQLLIFYYNICDIYRTYRIHQQMEFI